MSDPLVADPFGAFHFRLEIDSEEVGHLLGVSGLKTSTSPFEIEEGGNNAFVHKRVDRSRWEGLAIRYASSANRYLQAWREAFLRDPFDAELARSGAIIVLDNHGEAVRRYNFVRAWPVSWEGPELDGGSSDLAVESVELAHEGLTVSDP